MMDFASSRGADMLAGALTGLVITIPWMVACVGWASHWNAYINLSLTLGGGVLWATLFLACRDAVSA